MENLEVSQPDHGGQGQVAVPQVSPLGHGSEIEFKVSKPHQGGQVPPAIAACYHYLLPLRAWVLSRSRHIYLINELTSAALSIISIKLSLPKSLKST